MAPTRTNSDDKKYTVPSLEEIIFSCGICLATVSELYPANEDHPGSHSDEDDGLGTKLWIGNCVHVFCGRHLDGGGVPFHSSSEPPQAECPVCVLVDNNHEVRNLYGIRGLTEGKLDPAVPSTYVQCPPVSLDGAEPGVEALRFQYSRMKRYSQEVTRRWRSADRTLHKECKKYRKLKVEHQELQKIKDEIEKKLQSWEGRKDQIRHYMDTVSEMAADIQMMRRELVKMGYNVEKKSYGLEAIAQAPKQQPPVSRPLGGDSSTTLVGEPRKTSSSKRKHMEDNFYPDDEDIEQELSQEKAPSMPPPPLPPPRQAQQMRPPAINSQSVASGRSFLQPPARPLQREPPVQTYEIGHWRTGDDRASKQQHQDSLPAMQSMRLNSAAGLYRPFQKFAPPPSSRVVAAMPQQYKQIRSEQQHQVQPPRLQPAGLYSQAPTQHHYGEPPQDADFTFDMMQQDLQLGPSIQHPLHAEDVEIYEEDVSQSQSFAAPSAVPYRRSSDYRGAYRQSEAPVRRPDHDQPASSVLSPVSKGHGERGRQDGMQPPATRGLVSQQMRPPNIRSAAVPRARPFMAPPLTAERGIMRSAFPSDAQYGPSPSRQRLSHIKPISQWQSSAAPQRTSYQPAGSRPYSRPTNQQPAALMPPYSQAESRMPPPQSSQPYRTGRMTLPPAPSRQRGWDPKVSQIRGVRGARGAGPAALVRNGRQSVAPPYSARGPLYSQAGNKTDVRR